MYNYMNNFFESNEEPVGDKSKILSFEKLDELGVINGFNIISKSILDTFNIEKNSDNLFKIIKGDE